MDNQNQQGEKRRGIVDYVNNASRTVSNIKRASSSLRTINVALRTIGQIVTKPFPWVWVVVIIILLIVIFQLFFGGGTGMPFDLGDSQNPNLPGGSRANMCSTGSLDYYIPFRDTSILPLDPEAAKQQVLASWPRAQLQYWENIVSQSRDNGWNPAFVLSLWIEETGASHTTLVENGGGGAGSSRGHLGCAPWEDQTIGESLSCLFKPTNFGNYTNFEDLMCVYGGDSFSRAPCTFSSENPKFPPNIKDWYSRLVPSGLGATSPAGACLVSGGGWPTNGIITQGPLGAYDHARLARDIPEEALDIADPSGPPVFTTFDGTAIVHDCILDGDCSRGWGGYGNSVEVVSSGGTFRVIYGHLSSFTVTSGQNVKAGDQLGFMGTTGVSTGIHLHWGFRGINMATPNIPHDIVPLNCPTLNIPCSPASISSGGPGI